MTKQVVATTTKQVVECEFPARDQQGMAYTLRLCRQFTRPDPKGAWVPGTAALVVSDGRRVELVGKGVYRVMPGSIRLTSTDPAAI